MAYDEAVTKKIRQVLRQRKGFSKRKMSDGLAFMLNGNTCCGVINQDSVLRLDDQVVRQALELPHTREMDFSGTPIKTMLYVAPPGYQFDDDLPQWLQQALHFTSSLSRK